MMLKLRRMVGVVVSCATDGHIHCWHYTTDTFFTDSENLKPQKEEFICCAYKPAARLPPAVDGEPTDPNILGAAAQP